MEDETRFSTQTFGHDTLMCPVIRILGVEGKYVVKKTRCNQSASYFLVHRAPVRSLYMEY